ncbi:acyl-CoA dehydrogenase family protein [Nocardia sp. NBC_00881]|uniref:acyl-CoA dehydrogenase family protein n=1 Tax=Nocardia sp. NBC_00881 TaxID=2975995 RepID=UPI00386D76A7|nr:acyl-CoA dehydrogenase family protein [Nocardia sp. NBC_00881]
MDIEYGAEAEQFRLEIRAILAEELPADWAGIGAIPHLDETNEFVEHWRQVLHRRGLLGITWPTSYGGRGLTKLHQVVLTEEFAKAGVPTGGHNDTFGIKMVGNTLLLWGTDEQKEYFLPRILSGELRWCQGYSEPGAGSDLAGLSTRATERDGEWAIDGQKVWTSQAHRANWIFVLARTNPSAPKHRGLSFLLVPMEQPGVEVRPIRSATGDSEFNEVFFDGARTPLENVVGPVDSGWKVAQTLLGYERGDEAATNPILFRSEFDRIVTLARDNGVADDPVVRQRLAQLFIEVEIMRCLGYRVLTGYLSGSAPGPESSVSKLYWSEYHKRATDLAFDLAGMRIQVDVGRRPLRGYRTDDPGARNTTASWIGSYLNARSGTIYAGTSEVQRNIVAETVLGLPREPRRAS